jgi:hypothetical protein
MQKWEYLQVRGDVAEPLNTYGEQGWELIICVFSTWQGSPCEFYFKRPLTETPNTPPNSID